MNVNDLDPSAWVKRYFVEIGTGPVATLIEGTDVIACSRFGLIEVTATIARKGAAEQLVPSVLKSLLNQAEQDFAAFDAIPLTDNVLADAQDFAFRYGLRAGDALHLASAMAIANHHGLTAVTMISADKELLLASLQLGLRTVNPQ